MSQSEPLISTELLARLERLSISSRRRLRSNVLGGRRSVRHGASVEFTDYRDYLPGDDLRYVDWKAYARLSKLLVRLFTEEDDLTLHLLLDSSASMRFGAPVSKLLFAKRFCAALGVIALSSFDRCTLTTMPSSLAGAASILRSGSAVGSLLNTLQRVPASGGAKLSRALVRYAAGKAPPGVVVIVSDFYDHDISPGLLSRLAKRQSVILVHVVEPTELDPLALRQAGDEVRLIDSETGGFIEVTLTQTVIDDYLRQFNEFCASLESLAKTAGATYLRVSTDTPIDDVVLGSLRTKRVVE